MLGKDLIQALNSSLMSVQGLSKSDLDITDADSVEKKLLKIKPNFVILSAALTWVDYCEDHEDLAITINGNGTRNVALACKNIKAKLIYISTDYVFDGTKVGSYDENDDPSPINVYGRSKLLGEQNVIESLQNFLIIRTSWLFGLGGKNFVESIMTKGKAGESLRVVSDQIGAPTYTSDLAAAIVRLIEKGSKGIINISNTGFCSWKDFAVAIYKEIGAEEGKISSILTEDYGAKAPRPKNSKLSSDFFEQIAGYRLRSWEDALKDYVSQRKNTSILK